MGQCWLEESTLVSSSCKCTARTVAFDAPVGIRAFERRSLCLSRRIGLECVRKHHSEGRKARDLIHRSRPAGWKTPWKMEGGLRREASAVRRWWDSYRDFSGEHLQADER